MKLLVFIPMYNCRPQISRVLRSLSPFKEDFHGILLVDNRSQDGTVDEAQKSLNEFQFKNSTILINKQNVNLGGSHKVAFNFAIENGYDKLVVLHGDDQADFADISPLLKTESADVDCLLGARFHPQSKLIGYSKFRIFGNLVLNIVCSVVCKSKILDMGSGLNLYSRKFMSDKRYLSFPNDLTFNVSLLFHSYFAGYKVKFFPLTWREEDQISNAKLFRQMRIILALSFKTLLNRNLVYQNAFHKEYNYEIFYKA